MRSLTKHEMTFTFFDLLELFNRFELFVGQKLQALGSEAFLLPFPQGRGDKIPLQLLLITANNQ